MLYCRLHEPASGSQQLINQGHLHSCDVDVSEQGPYFETFYKELERGERKSEEVRAHLRVDATLEQQRYCRSCSDVKSFM